MTLIANLFGLLFSIVVVLWPIFIIGFFLWKSHKKNRPKDLWRHIVVLGIIQSAWIYFLYWQIGTAFEKGFFK